MVGFHSTPQRELPPAGEPLDSVLVDVIERNGVKSTYEGVERIRDVVTFVWQTADVDSKGKRFLVYADYTNSSHDKATLPKVLGSWLGHKLSSEEMATMQFEDLIGKICRLIMVHNEKGDRTYANVLNVLPGKVVIKPLDYIRRVDSARGDDPHGADTPF